MTEVLIDETVDEGRDSQGVVRLDELDQQLVGQLVDRARCGGVAAVR